MVNAAPKLGAGGVRVDDIWYNEEYVGMAGKRNIV